MGEKWQTKKHIYVWVPASSRICLCGQSDNCISCHDMYPCLTGDQPWFTGDQPYLQHEMHYFQLVAVAYLRYGMYGTCHGCHLKEAPLEGGATEQFLLKSDKPSLDSEKKKILQMYDQSLIIMGEKHWVKAGLCDLALPSVEREETETKNWLWAHRRPICISKSMEGAVV